MVGVRAAQCKIDAQNVLVGVEVSNDAVKLLPGARPFATVNANTTNHTGPAAV